MTSVHGRRSQPVDATLYLRGKRWSVGWNEDFIEVLLRQRRRSYGIAGSAKGAGVTNATILVPGGGRSGVLNQASGLNPYRFSDILSFGTGIVVAGHERNGNST
jgi:hypothetical protein